MLASVAQPARQLQGELLVAELRTGVQLGHIHIASTIDLTLFRFLISQRVPGVFEPGGAIDTFTSIRIEPCNCMSDARMLPRGEVLDTPSPCRHRLSQCSGECPVLSAHMLLLVPQNACRDH
jgi:hypothetical protein